MHFFLFWSIFAISSLGPFLANFDHFGFNFVTLLLQVQTTYETFETDNSESIYEVALETSREDETHLFLTLCLR